VCDIICGETNSRFVFSLLSLFFHVSHFDHFHSPSSDGIARSTSSLFNELRSFVFSRVVQAGIRAVARDTFAHLHQLDLKFHLNRNTGALSRSIDRGVRYV
jgi:hypothetical protein